MGLQNHKKDSGGRLMSLDALRGFDMFWIIGGVAIFRKLLEGTDSVFLNSVLTQLTHAKWEGFHWWDLVMPLFLFIVGTAMPFSFNKRLGQGQSKRQLYLHIIRRTAILFVLGMAAQGHLLAYDLSKLHIYCNTLQAIAAGYLIASVVLLNMNIVWEIITMALLLLLFWGLMVLVPVPGHAAGMLGPDENLAIYIDKLMLGRFQNGTNYTWILSSMTFACTVLLGVIAGQILRLGKSQRAKVIWLVGIGAGSLLAGKVWGNWFPIIKHLWTSSFVLFSGGWCYLLLALFYLIIDVLGLRKWAFGFVVIGMNPITVYMATRLYDFKHIGNVFVGGLSEWLGQWNDAVQELMAFAIIWLILFWMYCKKSFIKI